MRKILPLLAIGLVLLLTVIVAGKQTGLINFAGGSTDTVVKLDSTSPKLTYEGSWKKVNTTAAYSGSYMQSNEPGAKVSFEASNIYGFIFHLIENKNAGIANVYIDGQLIRDIDTYNSKKVYNPPSYPIRFWEDTYTHKVTLEVTDKKNPSSTGNLIMLDAVSLISYPNPQTAYVSPTIPSSENQIQNVDIKKLNATQYRLAITYYWDGQNGPVKITSQGNDSEGHNITSGTPPTAKPKVKHTTGTTLKLTSPDATVSYFVVCLQGNNGTSLVCQDVPLN